MSKFLNSFMALIMISVGSASMSKANVRAEDALTTQTAAEELSALNEEIRTRHGVLTHLYNQIRIAEDSTDVRTLLLISSAMTGVVGLSRAKGFIRTITVGLSAVAFSMNGYYFYLDKSKLPELRKRLAEEEIYINILRDRRDRMIDAQR